MSDVTTNFGIPLPGATITSKRLADIQSVRAAIIAIDGTIATGINTAVGNKVDSSLLGAPNGVATLNANGVIPEGQLPSFVDDVMEYANFAAFPVTGEAGKIFVALDDGKTYRWSGSVYVHITSGAVDSVNGQNGVVVITKTDLGLGNVDNTADSAKPVSTAQQTAILAAENNARAASAPIAHVGAAGSAHAVANGGANGFMSAADKVKLDAITGTNTGDQTNIAGNAGTATKLATARLINGVPFDGSADISLSASQPALTASQVGFGSGGGILTGSDAFTWTDAASSLSLGTGAAAAAVSIVAKASLSLNNPPSFTIQAAEGMTNGYGGALNLRAGNGNGSGGGNHVNISAGSGGATGGGGGGGGAGYSGGLGGIGGAGQVPGPNGDSGTLINGGAGAQSVGDDPLTFGSNGGALGNGACLTGKVYVNGGSGITGSAFGAQS